MILYARGFQATRAFIAFDNIQHISWNAIKSDNPQIECKIYSSSGTPILQIMPKEIFDEFLQRYKEYMGCV